MAHSYDSTLLQRMGFKDPDRQTSAHDAACIALATNPETLLVCLGIQHAEAVCLLETPLQKGDGKFASTVGFIDGIVLAKRNETTISCPDRMRRRGHYSDLDWQRCERCTDYVHPYAHEAVLVEVKTRIDNVGDLLRQMNLYREYKKDHEHARITKYVVWSLDRDDVQFSKLLAGQGYRLLAGPTLLDLEGE